MNLLDGKLVSAKIKEDIKVETAAFIAASGRKPHLVAILVGNDGGSETYVASKMRNCDLVGFESTNIRYDVDITQEQLIAKIKEINADPNIDGLIVQLPLPKHIDPEEITEAIDHRKDVDGFHPINLGRMQRNLPCFIPATPYGIMLMLAHYGIETAGKKAVVVGRSNIVGSPMSILLARNSNPGNCTVTLTHSRTQNLKQEVLEADIIVAAIGRKNFVTADMVKPGAVVIDVGINREVSSKTKSGYRLYGDVDFDAVSQKTSWITPVPGGVGLMTIVGLLKNTLEAAKGTIYMK
ncbi:MAG: bifunctional 5,10-methylenetetrahydrofolate dehydrogenase/5,10-methenyltetrahydrofolate cyclohydrolase [Sphingobacterium sp.]|uniref:bifunctional 5,10-methylenetetrahydrofolate dehydrogenase/5,10-methenyltetrahydrofolate cyclohydrolase n=1 Tax=Sphingobacterium sp. JB170 TaxID=1434842 RepID=UPI00097E9DF2|nr:tetrahydrofolate dehydrogenase/cyclohydrolase catalytic domain-containing protein [Sphingobacterium sp. JB170]SJN39143.1 Methylenetetrahydrofolate dehydrogenase (NADP+) / Methenyltetrahydrofolate cyclohydrolase [Sphingobacterium sp. JB170]